jgi:hypothetical protein
MIIYVNIDKQNGTVSVDTLEYPGDESLIQFNPHTLLNNENSMSFELHCDETRYAELAGLEMRIPDPEPPIEE